MFMENTNYDIEFKKIINNLKYKPKLLLHACCGPCSSYVLALLCDYFEITVLFYNPNIFPEDEYIKRKEELKKLINLMNNKNIKYLDIDYLSEDFYRISIGLEKEKEGGLRCNKCIELRLEKTAKLADLNHFEYFGTTLSVSPHKSTKMINELGKILENKYNIKFLYSDFKKNDGYKKSIENSKKYNLYRQNYCGCKYSTREEVEE